jgi:hypothetical protein
MKAVNTYALASAQSPEVPITLGLPNSKIPVIRSSRMSAD